MRNDQMGRVLCLMALLVVATNVIAADRVFVERFTSQEPGERWTIESTLQPPGLRWYEKGERAGFHFKSVAVPQYMKSHGYAWTEWRVGTRAFEAKWSIHVQRGLQQAWFHPGVVVALTSAPPGKMGKDDIAVAFGMIMGGPIAVVRRGGLYEFRKKDGKTVYSQFGDNRLSGLRLPGGGRVASAEWPSKRLDAANLTYRLRRNEKNVLKFELIYHGLPAGRGNPYWSGRWTMPEKVAGVPLRYIVVKRMPVKSTHVSYPGFVMRGVVHDMQARFLTASPAPVVNKAVPDRPVVAGGGRMKIAGRGFQKGVRVMVGGKEARSMSRLSAQKLTCVVPQLSSGKRHALSVINPNGLRGTLDRGVPYGRFLEEVRPREALPSGGDLVTVVGAGFEEDTVFEFGTQKAQVVDVPAPTRAKVRVPAGSKGRAKVEAYTGGKQFSGKPLFGYAPHPYLYFTAEEMSGLRKKFRDPMFKHYRTLVMRNAKSLLKKKPEGGLQAMQLAFAHAFSGKEKYRRRAIKSIRKGWTATEYDQFALMQVTGMAIAYDVLFRDLSPTDRAAFADYLDRMIEGYLRVKDAWFLGGGPNFSNTVPVGNSGGMLGGLALMYSTPAARRAIDVAANKAKRYPEECIAPDGACREGVQYWDFGLDFYLILAHALKNATGDGRGLLDHPHLKNTVKFVEAQLGGNGGMFAFNDNREPWLGGYAICADIGSRYDQPLLLWIADHCVKGGEAVRLRNIWAPFAFLWRDKQKSPELFPGVPTLSYLRSIHWGAMRSDTSFRPKLVLGFKGGMGPLTHHKQNDLGSFVVHANGEVYLTDPGYYEGKKTDHTLPLVDGKGPGVKGSKVVTAREKGPWRYVVLDSTDGYGDHARQVRRLFLMHDTDWAIVLDDVIPPQNKPGKITAQYQTAWKPSLTRGGMDTGMRITGQNGALLVQTCGHALDLTKKDRKFTSGWHWAKIDESGPGDWHTVSGQYRADPARPLITVLWPVKKQDKTPSLECKYKKDLISVSPGGQDSVRFVREDGEWKWEGP